MGIFWGSLVRSQAASRSGRTLGLVTGLPVAVALSTGVPAAGAALPPVPQPVENQITEPKRVLGKMLFWDEQMSTANVVSCGSCHVPAAGGTDPRLARHPGSDNVLNTPDDVLGSPGVIHADANDNFLRDALFALRPQVTSRAAPTMINAAYAPKLFWDGRADSVFVDPQTGLTAVATGGALESQSVNPPLSSVEMAHEGVDWAQVSDKLRRVHPLDLATNLPPDVGAALAGGKSYPDLFRDAFGDEQITAKRIAFAIATYERTLIADNTPWDRFVAGDNTALTQQQQRGLGAFQASNCTVCHTPPFFTNQTFRNIGLRPPAEDPGLRNVTNNANDRGKFKVPSLRNVGLQRSFMHNGEFQTLSDLIAFYAKAPGAAPQFPDNQDPVMQTVRVPPQAAPDLQAFLQTGLTDARVANQTTPFDHPTLFTNRPGDQATIINGGVAGSGGIVPRIIVQAPPMIGNKEFRLGLDGALGNSIARLGISLNPPVGGRITPTQILGEVLAVGAGNGQGLATFHWPLAPGLVAPGQVLFAQWFVTDPGAAGGEALSAVARLPFFCGSSGCPSLCGPADFDGDGFLTGADFDGFTDAFEAGTLTADFNTDGFVNGDDFDSYLAAFEQGC